MNESQYFTMIGKGRRKVRERRRTREREGDEAWKCEAGKRQRKSQLTGVIHHHCQLVKALNFYYYYVYVFVFLPACLCMFVCVGGNNGTWRWKRYDRRACITSTISDFSVLAIYRNSCRTFLISECVRVCVYVCASVRVCVYDVPIVPQLLLNLSLCPFHGTMDAL